jgi:hypothetical protein
MTPARENVAGAVRNCPHCRASILESAVRCPKCQHHVRFDSGAAARATRTFAPLAVEATIRHPPGDGAWEYSVLLVIRNERGEEVSRQVMGVGAMAAGDSRSFALSVEVYAPESRPVAAAR